MSSEGQLEGGIEDIGVVENGSQSSSVEAISQHSSTSRCSEVSKPGVSILSMPKWFETLSSYFEYVKKEKRSGNKPWTWYTLNCLLCATCPNPVVKQFNGKGSDSFVNHLKVIFVCYPARAGYSNLPNFYMISLGNSQKKIGKYFKETEEAKIAAAKLTPSVRSHTIPKPNSSDGAKKR